MFQKLCQPYFLKSFVQFFELLKLFLPSSLLQKQPTSFLRTNVFSSRGPATVVLKGHPAQCWVVQYKVQEKIAHPLRMRLRLDCSPWGIPMQSLISIGLSYKCISASRYTLLRRKTHTPAKRIKPTCMFITSYFRCLHKRHSEKSQFLFWCPGVSSFYFITIFFQGCHHCCWWKSLVPGSYCPHRAGNIDFRRKQRNKQNSSTAVGDICAPPSLTLWERIDIWFPDTKVSLATKFQWCS